MADVDMLNFTTEDGLKMFDALSRTNSTRQSKPLDQFNYIQYAHRALYDDFNLMIGDVFIMIPPEFIHVSSESFSQSIQTIRQENSQKQKTGYHKRTVNIDLVFNGMDEINGYKVPSPTHFDGKYETNYYYVDGLRTLLAQFKCTPFLPIKNDLLNNSYKIYVVALQSIVIETIEGFQNALMAHITLQEVDMMPYIEMPNIMFQHTIDWDLFRYYTQSMLTEHYEYKHLQSLPVNKDHTAFKLSILNESVLATVPADGQSKEESILEQVINPENYTCLVNSEESDVHITGFHCQYSNMLTSIQMSDACSPTLQYIGGLDTLFNIIFETTDQGVIGDIEQCQIMNDLMVRNNPKVRGSVGFVKIEADFVTFCGSLFCTIESVETHTVPGIPGLYQVKLLCVSYDIAQSRREELEGFLPFNGVESTINDLELTGSALESKFAKNANQTIQQSLSGLMTKIYQDNYAEWKLRTTMEVYPDLRLPTYSEVNQAISYINAFRSNNQLDPLPYNDYPTQPTNILFGNGEQVEFPNAWLDNGGSNIYDNGSMPSTNREYNGFVDPDFYVFYPNTYLSIYREELEKEKEQNQSTGSSIINQFTEPFKNSPLTHAFEYISDSIYGDGDDTDSKIKKFITTLRGLLGSHYGFSAEGEISDYMGPLFDELGLITYALKQLGILQSNFNRLSYKTFDSLDIFQEVPTSNIQRGDIIVNSAKNWCCVCTGYDKTGSTSVITSTEKDGVVEEQLMFEPGHIYRIIPLQPDSDMQGTQQSNPYPSEGNQYPDENGEILQKAPTALETTEGYVSDNPYGDDNQDTRGYNQQQPEQQNGNPSANTNTINQDLGSWSPISESELNACIASIAPANSPFRGNADVFIKAGQESGLDPRYILAHAALESGWGTSRIARDKNNYFGIGAFDSSPYSSAYSFSAGLAAGIIEGAKWISNNYYNGSYQQRTLNQMRNNGGVHQYATDPEWHNKIASIMDRMPSNNQSQYLGENAADNPENPSSFTNTDQIKLNEYNRRNRANTASELAEDTAPIQLDQSDISTLTLPEIEDDGSAWTDGSVGITNQRDMTIDEFNSLALTIATECEGEPFACKMAMAQYLYDKSQVYFGGVGLTAILQNLFFKVDKTKVDSQDLAEAENAVRNVFQSGMRWKKDYQILAFASMSTGNYGNLFMFSKYELVDNVGVHNFYGYKYRDAEDNLWKKLEAPNRLNPINGYNISGYGVSKSSSNATILEQVSSIFTKNLDNVKEFGRPVYIKSKHFDTHSSSVGKEWQGLNDTKNRLNTAFVDDVQYSGKGRLVKAFPTFLFCILDDQAQWYDGRKLWTNYYVYKPVVNIQCHSANDMPTATAQITVTNTYHNLDRSSAALINYSISNDKDYCWLNRWLYKNTGMIIGGVKITNRLIQMHSIIFDHTKVREGARIHLRMGYGSDPMSLAPIINGTISGMMLGDQISITVTSDGHELIQSITSDKTKDINNGALGLFGLGATQEASNIIASIMVKRESWMNHLFFGKKWFEGSKYNIEHFGLYLNSGDQYALQGGIDTGIYEQYDMLMNIYNASTEDGWIHCYRHWGYMYDSRSLLPGKDGESNIVFNQYNMTPWDVFQLCAQTMPEFLIKPEMYQFDSRLFYGLPFDLHKYRYDIVNGTVYQECKSNTQMHYIDSLTSIIENQVSVTSKYSFTNAKVIYTRGDTPKATAVIHSDDTIDHSKQSTHIIDSCIVQDYLGWDGFYEFTGISKQGKTAARKLGISNLLYGWQQQYQGQLLCLGCPQVRPDDFLMVNDFYTNLNGLAMVREVVHSFSTQTGFTTSIVPGVIGFSPEQDSGNITMIANFLKLYGQFTEYAQNRKMLKENCERYADLVASIDKAQRTINSGQFGMGVLRGIETTVNIAKDVSIGVEIYSMIRLVKNFKTLADAAKAVGEIAKATKAATQAVKFGRSVVGMVKAVQTVNTLSGVATDISAGLNAVGAAAAPETLGLSLAITLLITIVIDAILNALISWLENRNVVTLLPLWWEGKPFIAGVKDGEKILLIKDENSGSDENTGEDGVETDADELTTEDN